MPSLHLNFDRAIALCYHDVDDPDPRRLPPRHPGPRYRLALPNLLAHLRSIALDAGPLAVATLLDPHPAHPCPVLLTFDDGAASCLHHIAPALESLGWRGHFFITTSWIGLPGYLSPEGIRELARRGHLIGSHSHSHPEIMAALPPDRLRHEWRESCLRLSSILDEPVRAASVAGGFYSPRVLDAAADAGLEVLFTSEPRAALLQRQPCAALGRFMIVRGTPPATAGRLARGCLAPRLLQSLSWSLKQSLKSAAGPQYLALRRLLLRESGNLP